MGMEGSTVLQEEERIGGISTPLALGLAMKIAAVEIKSPPTRTAHYPLYPVL
jgi:hypothetical protein